MVRVEITDLTKPQKNQVFTAPARILPTRINNYHKKVKYDLSNRA